MFPARSQEAPAPGPEDQPAETEADQQELENRTELVLKAMINAAAEVNPATTGRESRMTTKPSRLNPITTCITPTISANSTTNSMYRSVPGSASAPTPVATMI